VHLPRQTTKAVTQCLDAELVMHVNNMKLFVMSIELNWGAVSLFHFIFFWGGEGVHDNRAYSFVRFLDHTQ